MHRLYDAHASKASAADMGHDWKSFRSNVPAIRKRGYHISRGELEPAIHAVAAPIEPYAHNPAAAIAIVASAAHFAMLNEALMISMVQQAASRIGLLMQQRNGQCWSAEDP